MQRPPSAEPLTPSSPPFSSLAPPHPSAHSHPPALCPDVLPSQAGNSRRQRPCLDRPCLLAQDAAPRQLSGTVKIQINKSGQGGREAGGVKSWPACQQIRCLQSSQRSPLWAHCHPSQAFLSKPLQPCYWGSPTMGYCYAPAPRNLQHLSSCPELTNGRAPLLLAPVQAAW